MAFECRKLFPGDKTVQSRRIEFLCRGCGVLECEKCSIAEHTKFGCGLVRITDIPKAELLKWVEEVNEVKSTLNCIAETSASPHQMGFSEVQMIQRAELVDRSINRQFSVLSDAITRRRDQLIAEANEMGKCQLEKMLKSTEGRSSHMNKLMQAKKMADSFVYKPNMPRVDLIAYVSKKLEIVRAIRQSLPNVMKAEVEDVVSWESPQFQTNPDDLSNLLNQIHSFGSISLRNICETGEFTEMNTSEHINTTIPPPPITSNSAVGNSRLLTDSTRPAKSTSTSVTTVVRQLESAQSSSKRPAVNPADMNAKRTKLIEEEKAFMSKYDHNVIVRNLAYVHPETQLETDTETTTAILELLNTTIGLQSVTGKPFRPEDFLKIHRFKKGFGELIRDVIVSFTCQCDRNALMEAYKNGQLKNFNKRQREENSPLTRIFTHQEPKRFQKLSYLLKVKSFLIQQRGYRAKEVEVHKEDQPEPTIWIRNRRYDVGSVPEEYYGTVGSFVENPHAHGHLNV